MWQLLPVVAGASLAAFVACLDVPFKSKIVQPALVFRTKEWWGLWLANGVVAAVLIYAADDSNKLKVATFVGFFSAIFGYPALVKMRLFTLRAENPKDERSVGPQIALDLAEAYLLPGIEDSIGEKTAQLLARYVNECGDEKAFGLISETAKNYIGGRSRTPETERQEATGYIDRLLADTQANPGNVGANARALFYKVQTFGGYRGTRWVLRKTKF